MNPATGKAASVKNPLTWGTFEQAVDACKKYKLPGIGFVFTLKDAYCGIDLDKCRNTETGETTPEAAGIVQQLNSYTEISASGKGLHIIVKGKLPDKRNRTGSVEMYDQGRYFIMTGNHLDETPGTIEDRQDELQELHRETFEPVTVSTQKGCSQQTAEEIIHKIGMGLQRDKFNRLFTQGDTSEHNNDESAADLALLSIIAFHAGGDDEKMDAIFRQSALMRDKWERADYRALTIAKAKQRPEGREAFDATDDFPEWQGIYGPGYCVNKAGSLCYLKKDRDSEYWVPMANFAARIVAEVLKDDGQQTALSFEIEGISQGGRKLPTLIVPVKNYKPMGWPLEGWGSRANVYPGGAVVDRLRSAIQNTGEMASYKTIYTHTGWRQIGGQWVFLHGGGAIGAENVTVELPVGLTRYCLPAQSEEEVRKAAQASMFLLSVAPLSITLPIWASAFLSPLVEPLKKAGYSPNFVVWLVGVPQVGKSTYVGLVTSLFGGSCGGDAAPANFQDTGGSLMLKAFSLKDSLLWVDDFHPTGSPQDQRRMLSAAETLIGGYGDRISRGRLTSDIQARQDKTPRGLCVVTGEDYPTSSQSRLARLFALEAGKGDFDFTKISQAQKHADLLPVCMAGYIDWLRPQMDTLPQTLKTKFIDLRDEYTKRGGYGRFAAGAAWLEIGAAFAFDYFKHLGAVSTEEYKLSMDAVREVLAKQGQDQERRTAEESPAVKFQTAIRELLLTGACYVQSLTGSERLNDVFDSESPNVSNPQREFVGWQDDKFYYLIPGTTYRAIFQFYARQGQNFPATEKTLWKYLAEGGYVHTEEGRTTATKRIQGKAIRLLWLFKARVDKNIDGGI